MEKKSKLNLKTIDFSKAKLSLGDDEKVSSAQSTPKLRLESETIRQTEYWSKLLKDLERASNNPSIKAYKQAEEDRKALIQTSVEKWKEPLLQNKMKEYEKLLKNPAFTMALEKQTSIQDYVSQIVNSFNSKNYEAVKKELEGFQPQLNSVYLAVQSAVEQMQKTLQSPSVQSSLSQLENFGVYESGLAKAADSIAKNEDMIKAAQSFNEIGKSIVKDSFQQRMNEHATANLSIMPSRNFEIPKSPLVEHSKRIVEQNDQLIETAKLQNDILNDMAEYMRLQNSYTDQSVKELERQNEQIEDQIEQKEYEIESNSEATKHTLWIAIASIVISIIVSGVSVWATYDVYNRENISGNQDHVELLKTIKESSNTVNLAKELQYQKDANSIQQQQMIRLNQEVEQLKMKVLQ